MNAPAQDSSREQHVFEAPGTMHLAKFLGDLWAVRHDIERARRVYRKDSKS